LLSRGKISPRFHKRGYERARLLPSAATKVVSVPERDFFTGAIR